MTSLLRYALLLVVALVVVGCPPRPPDGPGRRFGAEDDQLFGDGERTAYRLEHRLLLEYGEGRLNQEVRMELDLAAWGSGRRKFVLERQVRPSTSTRTYGSGLSPVPTSVPPSVEVKSLFEVAGDDDWEAIGGPAGAEALARWKERYPQLVEAIEVEDPRFYFRFVEGAAGRFGFYREPEGTVLLAPDGRPDRAGFHKVFTERYRWFDPEDPEAVDPTRVFEGLVWALTAFDHSPFPEERARFLRKAPSGGWTARTEHAVRAILEATLAITPILKVGLDDWEEVPFDVAYRLEGIDGKRYRLVGEGVDFPGGGDLGQGYALSSYRREVVYDLDLGRFLLDRVAIRGVHEDGSRIELDLTLRDRSFEGGR